MTVANNRMQTCLLKLQPSATGDTGRGACEWPSAGIAQQHQGQTVNTPLDSSPHTTRYLGSGVLTGDTTGKETESEITWSQGALKMA